MGEQNRIYSFSKIRIPQSEIRNQLETFEKCSFLFKFKEG